MPTSRKRLKNKTRSRSARPVRPPRPASTADDRVCFHLTGPDLIEQMDELRTDEDEQAFLDAADAEAAGDPALAIECLLRGLVVDGTPRLPQLRELADLGDDAPSWALARWVVDQAYRWMLIEEDPRATEAVITTVASCYPQVDLDRPLGLSFREFATRIAANDWVAQQVATFELGGLIDFLDTRISDALLARCATVRDWAAVPMGGYVLRRRQDGVLDADNLRDGSTTTVLDLGALFERGDESTVIGRLVPIDAAPGLMFESRPLEVDLETARAVALAHDVDDWLEALYAAGVAGRLPLHFSARRSTPMTSDLVPMDGWGSIAHLDDAAPAPREPAGCSVELQAMGLDSLRANNVMVCEVALIVAEVSPDALGCVGVSLHAVLTDRATFEAARIHCAKPEHAELWTALAGVVPEPTRSRCLALARGCSHPLPRDLSA